MQGPEKTDNLVRSRLETTDYMHASNIFKLQRKELMSVEARSKTGRATEICATYHGARTKTLFRSFEDRPHFVPKLSWHSATVTGKLSVDWKSEDKNRHQYL